MRRQTWGRKGPGSYEVEEAFLISSLDLRRHTPAELLAFNRGHWGIENRTHHVRDVTFAEDRHQLRSGAAPQAFAACTNLAIALLRRQGWQNIAEALRHHAGRPRRAVALVASAGGS